MSTMKDLQSTIAKIRDYLDDVQDHDLTADEIQAATRLLDEAASVMDSALQWPVELRKAHTAPATAALMRKTPEERTAIAKKAAAARWGNR